MIRTSFSWAVLLVGLLLASARCAALAPGPGAAEVCGIGRACLPDGGPSDASIVALAATRRVVLEPHEMAFIQRGGSRGPGVLPASVTLGRSEDGPSAVLVRFELPSDREVVAAYLLLDATDDAVAGDAGVAVHAERIVDPWDARSVTWTNGPTLRDVHAPSAPLRARASGPVRLDVTALFARPGGAELPDQGMAIVASGFRLRGSGLVLVPGLLSTLIGESPEPGAAARRGPRLELYVK